jgi:hypothetical protein
MFSVTSTTDITAHQIADLMTSAMEGGSGYWIASITPRYLKHEEYSSADAYGPTMVPRTFKAEDDDNEYILDFEAIQKGLQVMADNFPTDFGDLRNDEADADTADIFLQCCLFGDLIYV